MRAGELSRPALPHALNNGGTWEHDQHDFGDSYVARRRGDRGTLSLFSQRVVERSAVRRHAATLLEGRRQERLAHLIAFIETAQEAERLAINLHKHNASGDTWVDRTDATLDRLWVRLRAVQLLCPSEVSEAARALAGQAHEGRQARARRSICHNLPAPKSDEPHCAGAHRPWRSGG